MIASPPRSKDHFPNQHSSLAPASVARASVTFLSKAASKSAVDFACSSRKGGAPGGAISSSSFSKVCEVQLGMLARCVARPPNELDFSWGFHSNFLSGTRSSVRRVFAISCLNSGIIISLSVIIPPVKYENCHQQRIVRASDYKYACESSSSRFG